MKRKYDVVFTRSEAIAPFPRLVHAAQCVGELGLSCLAIGWDRERIHPKFERKGNLDIIRLRFKGRYGSGMGNLLGLLLFNATLFFIFLRLRPRCIHAYDLDTVIPALLVRSLIRCKVIYDIADWYSESRKVGRFKTFIDRIERWTCRKADFVIVAHEKRLIQLGFEPRKWVAVHNVPQDIRGKIASQKPPIQGDYFAYVGVLYPDRGLDQIVRAASLSKVKTVIAGFGSLENYCREASEREPYIDFLGKIPYEETLKIEGNALAVLALYDPSFRNNQLAAPNKLYEAMMLGRPLVTNRGTLVGELVEEEKIGITFAYGDVKGLASVMEWLKEHPEEREEMGLRARRLYETRYSFEEQKENLLRTYREILKS